jgi:hypothetical protein
MKGANVEDVVLHSQIDMNTIDRQKDNNEYSKPKSGNSSFFDMLFVNNDYSNM